MHAHKRQQSIRALVLFSGLAGLACAAQAQWVTTDLGVIHGGQGHGLQSRPTAMNASGLVTVHSDRPDSTGSLITRAFLYSRSGVTDIGTLGGPFSYPSAINAAGQITGASSLPGSVAVRPFLYSGGRMVDLGSLGGSSSYGSVINASGQVAGDSSLPGNNMTYHAFRSNGSGLTDLGTLGGRSSYAIAINGAGQVAGTSEVAGNAYLSAVHAFISNGSEMTDLGTLGPEGTSSRASAINASGQVVGSSGTAGNVTHAFRYDGGVMRDLGTLGGPSSGATRINDAGQVAGWSGTANGERHAFLFSDGKMRDLGVFGYYSQATGINASGQVVGFRYASDVENGEDGAAFFYSEGKVYDIRTLVTGFRSVDFAVLLNDAGQISGSGLFAADNQPHVFLLSPVPEPSALAMFSLGLGWLGWSAGRKRSDAACAS